MKNKRFLAAILLGVVLCFVSGAGYGEVLLRGEMEVSSIEFLLLEDRIDYIMFNPTVPLIVDFHYDSDGQGGIFFPERVNTKGKIFVWIQDRTDVFYDEAGKVLLDQLEKSLTNIYVFIMAEATDMDTDVAAIFLDREEIPLAYFYQGEYHLWEE